MFTPSPAHGSASPAAPPRVRLLPASCQSARPRRRGTRRCMPDGLASRTGRCVAQRRQSRRHALASTFCATARAPCRSLFPCTCRRAQIGAAATRHAPHVKQSSFSRTRVRAQAALLPHASRAETNMALMRSRSRAAACGSSSLLLSLFLLSCPDALHGTSLGGDRQLHVLRGDAGGTVNTQRLSGGAVRALGVNASGATNGVLPPHGLPVPGTVHPDVRVRLPAACVPCCADGSSLPRWRPSSCCRGSRACTCIATS